MQGSAAAPALRAAATPPRPRARVPAASGLRWRPLPLVRRPTGVWLAAWPPACAARGRGSGRPCTCERPSWWRPWRMCRWWPAPTVHLPRSGSGARVHCATPAPLSSSVHCACPHRYQQGLLVALDVHPLAPHEPTATASTLRGYRGPSPPAFVITARAVPNPFRATPSLVPATLLGVDHALAPRLVFRAKGQDEAAAAAALADVTALSCRMELRGTRGKLYQAGRGLQSRAGLPRTGNRPPVDGAAGRSC